MADTILRRVRTFSVSILVAMLLAVVSGSPAVAQEPLDQGDKAGRTQAEVKEQLDLTKASDSKVEVEVNRLNQAVADQDARVAASRQAKEAATAQVASATRELEATEVRAAAARRALAQHSIDAYVHPSSQNGLNSVVTANSFDEAGRRQVMLSVVQSSTTDVISQLRATRQDQRDAAEALGTAQREATAREGAEARQADVLNTQLAQQKAARDQLDGRIRELAAEGQVLAAQQSQIEELLRARSPQPEAPAPSSGRPIPPPSASDGPTESPSASGGPVAPASPRQAQSRGGFIWPIDGTVTSEFGPRWGTFHPGLDISDPEGTPIAAAMAGVVVFAGPNDGYGNFVVIDHGGGFATAYAHQSRLAVSEGEQVSQGQTIGYVGSTGFSTGNHLHFEVRVNGTPENPRNYLP